MFDLAPLLVKISGMCVLRLLNVLTSASYEAMTFPHFRPRLGDLAPGSPTVAVGVSYEGRSIGLGLAELLSDGRSGNILSVFVVPDHRNRGIGTALIGRLEGELQTRGCTQLELVYSLDAPATPAIERILEKWGWSAPQPRMLLCHGDRRILEAPWIGRARLPVGFSIFPWSELTADDRSAMRRQQDFQPWYPEALSPFQDEGMAEPGSSLGLRHQGQVVGWLITHRVSSMLIRYHSLFIRADLRRRGCVLPLLAEAFRRQTQHHGLDSLTSCGIRLDNQPVVRFARRHERYLLSVRETRARRKNLLQASCRATRLAKTPSS